MPHACPAFLKYALLVIKNIPIKKTKIIFCIYGRGYLPQSQALLREGKMFHYKLHSNYKLHSKLYRNTELDF